ncbi:MAG TPA: hypothetical protein PKW90_29890, partial [Myxococcota bacterium]|nr:hypothetical protein [Myxococcota bacterium]
MLVTRDPGRLPYSLWVCEGHRSLLMKAEAERKAQKPATVAPKFSADSPCPGSGRMWTPRRSDALPHAPAIPAGAPPAPEEPMPKAPPTIKATINPDLCKIEGCDRPRHARGLCSPHWATGKNHGWLDQIGDPKKAPGPQKLPRPAPAGAEKALAEISRIQRERAAPTLAEAAALANKIAEAEIEFVPPADKAELATVNKKPVDLGDVPGWPAITPELSDDEAQQSRLTGELADAWDRTWTFESDGDRPCRWISRNKLNNQVSLIVWWDDAWIWRAVDGDRVLAFGSGDSAAEIAGQYKEWNKGGTIVDNDWNGAAETGTGDSDSLISGVVGID